MSLLARVHDLNRRRVRHLRGGTQVSREMTRRPVAPPWQVHEIVSPVRPEWDLEGLPWGVLGSDVATCCANGIRGTGGRLLQVAPMPAPER